MYDGTDSLAIDRVWAILHQRNTSTQSPNYVRVKSARVLDWYTARRVGEPMYGYKTLVEDDTGRILGAHLVGPQPTR